MCADCAGRVALRVVAAAATPSAVVRRKNPADMAVPIVWESIRVVPAPAVSFPCGSQSETTENPHDPFRVAVYAIGTVVDTNCWPFLLDAPTVGCVVSVRTMTRSSDCMWSTAVPVDTVTVIAAEVVTGAVQIAACAFATNVCPNRSNCCNVNGRCTPRLSVIDGDPGTMESCVLPAQRTTSREFAGGVNDADATVGALTAELRAVAGDEASIASPVTPPLTATETVAYPCVAVQVKVLVPVVPDADNTRDAVDDPVKKPSATSVRSVIPDGWVKLGVALAAPFVCTIETSSASAVDGDTAGATIAVVDAVAPPVATVPSMKLAVLTVDPSRTMTCSETSSSVTRLPLPVCVPATVVTAVQNLTCAWLAPWSAVPRSVSPDSA